MSSERELLEQKVDEILQSSEEVDKDIANKLIELESKMIKNHMVKKLMKVYIKISEYFYAIHDFDKTLSYIHKTNIIAESINDTEQIISNHSCNAVIYWYQRKLEKTEKELKQAEKLIKINNLELKYFRVYNNLGLFYNSSKDYENAFIYFKKALQIARENSNTLDEIMVSTNLQLIYISIADYKNLEKQCLDTISLIYKSKINDQTIIVPSKLNLGTAYIKTNRVDDSIKLYIEVLEIYKKHKFNLNWLVDAYNNLAQAYIRIQNYVKAKKYLIINLEIVLENNIKSELPIIYHNLSSCEQVAQNYIKAEEYLQRSEAIINEENYADLKIDLHLAKAKFYSFRKRYEEADKEWNQYYELVKENFNSEIAKRLADQQIKFQIEQKAYESEILKKKNIQLKETNKKLKEAQDKIRKLERKSAISAMIVTTNHEINQPLMILKGNLDLMKFKLNNPEFDSYFQKSDQAIFRIFDTLQKFENSTKIEEENYTENTKMISFDE